MTVRVSLTNPRVYQREAILLFGGGALSGGVAAILQTIAGAPISQLSVLAFGAIVGLLANLTDSKQGTPMLRLTGAMLGGVVMAGLWAINPILAGFAGGGLLGLSLSVGEARSRQESLGIWLLYSVALAAGVFVTSRLGTEFAASTISLSIMTSAVWGLFLAFAAGLKRLDWQRDELWSEFRDAEADLKGAEGEDITAGRVLYEAILKELERSKENDLKSRAREITEETCRALIAFAKRSSELQYAADVTQHRQLRKRVVEMNERLKGTRDPQVIKEMEATLHELTEQLRVRSRLEVARLRLEARRQRCFTALERLHVSLLQSGGGAFDSALEESIESLERLTDEVSWRNLSVDELAGDTIGESLEELVLSADPQVERAEDDIELGDSETEVVLDTSCDTVERAQEESDGTDGSIHEESLEAELSSHRTS